MRDTNEDETKSIFFLTSKNNIVIDASPGFVNLSGYSLAKLLGKSLNDISQMIRIDAQIMLEDIQDEAKVYFFTQSLELMEATILCQILNDSKERRFYFKLHTTDAIEEQFCFSQQLYTNRKTGIIIVSFPDLVVLKVSENYLGYLEAPYNKRQNILGKRYRQIVPEHISSIMDTYSQYTKNTGQPHYVEEDKFHHPTGEIKYWDSSTVPVFQNGQIKYLIHSTVNVTERVLSQQAVERKNKELETIIENISEELIILNKDGQVARMNKAARSNRLYDFTVSNKAEEIAKQMEVFNLDNEIIPPQDRPVQKVLRQERFSSYRIIMKNSRAVQYKEVSGTPIYDSNNEFMAGVLIYRDIADVLMKEENVLLKTQYNLLNTIIENLELGLVRFSYPKLEMIDMNNNFVNNFMVDKSGIELELFPFKDRKRVMKHLKMVVDEKDGTHFEIKQFNTSGEERFFKFIYQPLFKLNHKVKEIIVMAVEITEQVAEKNKLEQILKVQEEVFVNISHECRTPLNIIFSTCQLMELYLMGDLNEETKNKVVKNIHSIKQNCNRFIKIINNVIDLSQIESGERNLNLRNEDIVSKVEGVAQSVLVYAKEKGINIIFDTNIEEKYIAVDIGKIERAILNLISNAIKFSDKGREIYIDITDQGDTVAICVTDNGIGIEEKYLESIFNRFSQVDKSLMRTAEGSGIGLSLVKAIVDMHGGKVSVESEIGKGSKFKIELPAITIDEPQGLDRHKDFDVQNNRLSVEFSDIY